jgi:PAS domain S-box-containing protein
MNQANASHSRLLRYSVAAVSVALAIALTYWIQPLKELPAVLFLAVVILTSLYGGARVGLAAAISSTVALNYFFWEPVFVLSFTGHEVVKTSVFLLVSTLSWYLIEKRNSAADRSRESEEQLRRALQAAKMVAWNWNPVSDKLTVIGNLQEIYGLSSLEASKQGFAVLHPKDLERHLAMVQAVAAEGGSYHSEFRIVRPDNGAVAWMEERAEAILDEAGNVCKLTGVVMDVSERKRAEEAIRFQANLLDSIEESTIVTDLNGTITYWNRFAEKLYGWAASDAIGRNIVEVTPSNLSREEASEILSRLKRGESWSGEFIVQHRDGSMFPAMVTDSPVCDGNGQLVGIIGVSIDISERKRIEAERAELLVREQEARKLAETASRMKDEFLANLSHELRTPLNAIVGWSEMLKRKQVIGQVAEQAIDVIQRNARAQAQIIEDLLDVSRIIAGKLALNAEPVELKKVVEAALDAIQPIAGAKRVTVTKSFAETDYHVVGDPVRLQQIVWNLLTNAVKFAPGGRVDVRVESDDAAVRIVVEDTGQGISADFLPFIFERFWQADSSYSRRHSGLGLGLGIVRHLVEMHGGTVDAHSMGEGRGSTFTVTLPLALAVNAPIPRSCSPTTGDEAAHDNGARSLEGIRVLVVDDDADTRDVLTALLELEGAAVSTARNTVEALDTLKRIRPDLLISDIGMPGEDGYDLIRKVRSLTSEEGGRIPAVALTGYASNEESVRAQEAGFESHLAKPVDSNKLIEALTTLAGSGG